MDTRQFKNIEEGFLSFHQGFSAAFGRKQWRERSQDYLRGLLVQAEERNNAENLSEVVNASARVLQRFLTEARWDDMRVIEELQKFAAPRLIGPERWLIGSRKGAVLTRRPQPEKIGIGSCLRK